MIFENYIHHLCDLVSFEIKKLANKRQTILNEIKNNQAEVKMTNEDNAMIIFGTT